MQIIKTTCFFILIGMLSSSCNNDSNTTMAETKKPEVKLSTPWTDQIDPDNVHGEYPRPIQQREKWKNLNGYWEVETKKMDTIPFGKKLSKQILVPFAVESFLSGLEEKTDDLLYRKTIEIPQDWNGQQIMLNFEGVDYDAVVYVNGKEVGDHQGAFDYFSFDITPFLTENKEQEIIVKVHDASNDGLQPVGKQVKEPEGIFYTSTTGIWKTVWIEPVNKSHIESFKITPDIDASTVHFTAETATEGDLKISIMDGATEVVTASGTSGEELKIKIPNAKLWSPENPFLYDMKVQLLSGDSITDAFKSYVAMRKISLGKDHGDTKIFLNNKPYFQVGVLDQGYWPDGLMTPPTEDAYIWDIQTFKNMGFNLLRKHAKTESQRWYYLCDKIGMLVWQDMPQVYPHENFAAMQKQADKEEFEKEFKNMIDDLYNYQSIVMWVVFNEAWGQYDTERLTKWVKSMDPDRLVSNASGWTDKNVGDIVDMHSYPGPDVNPVEESRATVLGEFGGLGLPIKGHLWQKTSWGYRNMADSLDFKKSYTELWDKVWEMKKDAAASAVVYTQLSDVEGEVNGLVTYDRKVIKIPVDYLHDVHTDNFVSPVEIESPQHLFVDNVKVSLKNRKDQPIFYTLDGSKPSAESKKYNRPITLNANTELKTVAIENGKESFVTSRSFEKVETYQKPEESITTKDLKSGLNYAIYEGKWEKLPDFGKLKAVNEGITSIFQLSELSKKVFHFGLVFKGYLKIDKDGIYVIQLKADDGVRLILDGRKVIEHDGIHGMDLNEKEFALAKGNHHIELQYFQGEGGSGLEFEVINEQGKPLKEPLYSKK